jgi:hypothetical protein
MKKMMIRTLVTVTLVVSSVSILAVAQNRPLVRAKIPFGFTVANKQLPAGNYTISRTANSNQIVLIRSEKGGDAVYSLSNSRQASSVSGETKLVFRRYGDQYFLSQMWTKGDISGTTFPVSRAERKMLKSGGNLAKADTNAEEIVVVVD